MICRMRRFKDLLAAKQAAVDAGAAQYIANLCKPCEIPSSRRHEQIVMAMVIHSENLPVSVTVSPDEEPRQGMRGAAV